MKAQSYSSTLSLISALAGGVGGQYQRPRALKEILHLPLEYTGQSNSWIDRKIFKKWGFHIFGPSMEEYFRKVGMPERTLFSV